MSIRNIFKMPKAVSILELDEDDLRCSYCGAISSEWDHLRSIVKDKKLTGYISEIHNLVQSCGKCNQSKGNKYWYDWIISSAKLSPKSKGVPDLDKRIDRLKKYEKRKNVQPIDFKRIIGKY